MNYEERYKQAIEAAKRELNCCGTLNCDSARQIFRLFPELRESEDERIRKEIIDYIILYQDSLTTEEYNSWITWLEKQGEQDQKHFELKAGHWYICHHAYCCRADHLTVKEGERFMCEKDGVVKGFVIKDPEKYFKEVCAPAPIEDEQKTTDKVGLKFKVGDWITNGEYTWNVINIQPLDYILQSPNGDVVDDTISYVDEEFHLWTIQDAKDGDVLMANAPFIFNGNLEGGIGCPGAHCGINTLGKFQIPKYQEHWTGHTTTPANKEQHDLLFSKMEEAGYEWDAEKKELKKIEQNSAWSEEDEERIEFLIAMCDDEQAECVNNSTIYRECTETKDWLKSLKDRVQPQSKQEWSEEDEKMWLQVINEIEAIKSNSSTIFEKNIAQDKINWLKSLKPQQNQYDKGYNDGYSAAKYNHWKPSEEQMEALLYALGKGGNYNHEALTQLYNNLKTL